MLVCRKKVLPGSLFMEGCPMSLPRRSDLILTGELAPDFEAQASDGTILRLADLRDTAGVVLVFYPADDTPGCTAQLCRLRDNWAEFSRQNIRIYGVNPAGSDRHAAFVARHTFPFPLLSDPGGKIAGAFGCRGWFGLMRRTVYGIDQKGRIVFAQRGNPTPDTILRAFENEASLMTQE